MKRGFTLIELLGIIVVLGIIATIVTPVIQSTLAQNQESVYNTLVKQIEGNAKDYLEYNTDKLPQDEGDSVVVKLGEMKEAGFIQISIKNPKTDNIISNESYVTVTKKGNNYTFGTTIYDLTDADEVVSGAPIISVLEDKENKVKKLNETISIGSTYKFDEKVTVDGTEDSDFSRQIIKDNKEVASIDTSVKGIYEIYYSKLKDGKLGIMIRTIRVA